MPTEKIENFLDKAEETVEKYWALLMVGGAFALWGYMVVSSDKKNDEFRKQSLQEYRNYLLVEAAKPKQ